jgi:hypothetical protein
MEDIYPVQAYLHKINKAPSVIISDIPALWYEIMNVELCSWDTQPLCICLPKVEARISSHNQVLRAITFFLASTVRRRWQMTEVLTDVQRNSYEEYRSHPVPCLGRFHKLR